MNISLGLRLLGLVLVHRVRGQNMYVWRFHEIDLGSTPIDSGEHRYLCGLGCFVSSAGYWGGIVTLGIYHEA